MEGIAFIRPENRYIKSYWNMFDEIARERIYLGRTRGFRYYQTVNFVRNAIEKNIPFLFVLDCATDNIVGWSDIEPLDCQCGSLGIGLLKEYRGRGLGEALMKEILKAGREFGYQSVFLEVRGSNRRAQCLYRKFGFYENGIAARGLMKVGIQDDVIHMRMDY